MALNANVAEAVAEIQETLGALTVDEAHAPRSAPRRASGT